MTMKHLVTALLGKHHLVMANILLAALLFSGGNNARVNMQIWPHAENRVAPLHTEERRSRFTSYSTSLFTDGGDDFTG